MKKIVTNNLGLKIGSVILAIIVWFLVVNSSNPIRNEIFSDIPITVVNASYVESMGLSYQLTEQDRVKVSIRANNEVLKNLKEEDLIVTADLTQIINMDSDPVMVPLSFSCIKYPNLDLRNITISPRNVRIELEDLSSKDFVITASTGETKPDKEFEIGEMQADPEKITINGPKSIINKIDRVVAQVNADGLSKDTDLSGKIFIYDKNQEVLSNYQMSYLTLKDIQEAQTVNVHVTLWKKKTDVAVKAGASGTPEKGYQIAEVDTTPATITVVGSQEALQQLSENGNMIEIPESKVDATGYSEDFETKIDISEFLPENIRLATDVTSSVLVSTTILPYGSQAYEVPAVNIGQQNLGTGLRAVFDREKIQVRIKGSDDQLKGLKPDEIKGVVDLGQYSAGTYVVPVQITLAEGLELVSEPTVSVTISSVEQETTEAAVSESITKSN